MRKERYVWHKKWRVEEVEHDQPGSICREENGENETDSGTTQQVVQMCWGQGRRCRATAMRVLGWSWSRGYGTRSSKRTLFRGESKKRRKQQEQREQKNKSECEIQSLKGDEDDKIEEVNECVYLVNQMTRCGVDME